MTIKDIKLGLRMMKYGLQYKTMMIMFFLFFLFGTLFEVLPVFGSNVFSLGNMGGLYLIIIGTYMYQMVITSTISTYVSSSPKALKIQSLIPGVITCATMVLGFLYFVLLRTLRTTAWLYVNDPGFVTENYSGLLLVSALAFVIQIYNAFAYKFFRISMIIMLIVEVPLITTGMNGNINIALPTSSVWVYVLTGLAIIVLGGVIGVFCGNLIKRKPLDPKTYKTAMTRAGK